MKPYYVAMLLVCAIGAGMIIGGEIAYDRMGVILL
jgi:hypothetical protein